MSFPLEYNQAFTQAVAGIKDFQMPPIISNKDMESADVKEKITLIRSNINVLNETMNELKNYKEIIKSNAPGSGIKSFFQSVKDSFPFGGVSGALRKADVHLTKLQKQVTQLEKREKQVENEMDRQIFDKAVKGHGILFNAAFDEYKAKQGKRFETRSLALPLQKLQAVSTFQDFSNLDMGKKSFTHLINDLFNPKITAQDMMGKLKKTPKSEGLNFKNTEKMAADLMEGSRQLLAEADFSDYESAMKDIKGGVERPEAEREFKFGEANLDKFLTNERRVYASMKKDDPILKKYQGLMDGFALRVNNIGDLVLQEVLKDTDDKTRMEKINCFLKVADTCINKNDLYTAQAIIIGLSHTAISRLAKIPRLSEELTKVNNDINLLRGKIVNAEKAMYAAKTPENLNEYLEKNRLTFPSMVKLAGWIKDNEDPIKLRRFDNISLLHSIKKQFDNGNVQNQTIKPIEENLAQREFDTSNNRYFDASYKLLPRAGH